MDNDMIVLENNDLGILFSDDNIYIDFDKFKSKEIQYLFITGMSGGGKTYLSEKIKKSLKCEIIHLDQYTENKYVKAYFKANPTARNTLIELYKNSKGIFDHNYWKTRMTIMKDALRWVVKTYKDKQFIFEGVQVPIIYRMEMANNDYELFRKDKFALILISTSFSKSFFRRIVRDNISLFKWYSNPMQLINQYLDWFDSQNHFREDIFKSKGIEYNE